MPNRRQYPATPKPADPKSDADASEETVIMTRGSQARAEPPSAAESAASLRRSLIDSLTDGVAAVDMNGRFIEFNRAGAAILGKGATTQPSESWSENYGLFEVDGRTPIPHERLPLVRALGGEYVDDFDMFVRNEQIPDGKWLRVRSAPIHDESRRQIGAVAWFRDVSERRRAEQALEAERKFLRHLIQTQDRDRQLTAFDLHDGVVQLMTGASLRFEAYRGKHAEAADDADLRAGMELVREGIEEGRRMIGGMRPPVIDNHGIVGAIDYLADPAHRDDNLRVEFAHSVQFVRLSALQESTLFRIVQEALHNTSRHSDSTRARVLLEQRGDKIYLEIRDWGKGFDARARNFRRFGLRGIDERSKLLGGSAEVESAPGRGTVVRVTLPLRNDGQYDTTDTDI